MGRPASSKQEENIPTQRRLLLLTSCGGATVPAAEKAAVNPSGPPSANLRLADINVAEIDVLAPGRVHDSEYNQLLVVERRITHGKESIPYLVSKLDDETKIVGHVVDYWYDLRVGDVALIVLPDFFTESTGKQQQFPTLDGMSS